MPLAQCLSSQKSRDQGSLQTCKLITSYRPPASPVSCADGRPTVQARWKIEVDEERSCNYGQDPLECARAEQRQMPDSYCGAIKTRRSEHERIMNVAALPGSADGWREGRVSGWPETNAPGGFGGDLPACTGRTSPRVGGSDAWEAWRTETLASSDVPEVSHALQPGHKRRGGSSRAMSCGMDGPLASCHL